MGSELFSLLLFSLFYFVVCGQRFRRKECSGILKTKMACPVCNHGTFGEDEASPVSGGEIRETRRGSVSTQVKTGGGGRSVVATWGWGWGWGRGRRMSRLAYCGQQSSS